MAKTEAVLTGKRCKCPVCYEVFSTESNFNRHRKGDYGVNRHCIDPEDAGLVIVALASGTVWKMPPREDYAP